MWLCASLFPFLFRQNPFLFHFLRHSLSYYLLPSLSLYPRLSSDLFLCLSASSPFASRQHSSPPISVLPCYCRRNSTPAIITLLRSAVQCFPGTTNQPRRFVLIRDNNSGMKWQGGDPTPHTPTDTQGHVMKGSTQKHADQCIEWSPPFMYSIRMYWISGVSLTSS